MNGGTFAGQRTLAATDSGVGITPNWVINGGVLNGDITGLQATVMGASTLSVTGGAFTGGDAGALIKGSGKLSGGTFTGSGEDAYAVKNADINGTAHDLLAPGKAYFTDDGQPLTSDDERQLGQDATLRVADTGSTPAPLYSISGKVTDELAPGISGHIRLLQNGLVLRVRVLSGDEGGTPYTFTGLAPGVYTVVAVNATGGNGNLEQTATMFVTIKDQDLTDVDFGWFTGGVGSEVEVKPNTPPVAVGGLDEIAAEYVCDGTVDFGVVRLTAEAKDEPADKDDIVAVAGGKTLEYLDLSLMFIQTDSTEIDLGDSNTVVLELVLPYDFTNRRNVTVYRHHDGAATALTALNGAPDVPADGSFWADTANGYIHIYASKFSTYAIGYTKPSSGGGGGGTSSYTITATAGAGGTISPSGKVSVTRGGDKTFTIEPDDGYTVADVLVDGKSVGAVESYTFEKVTGAHTIAASFRKADKAAWNPFTDVKEGAWYYDSVKYVYEHDLMLGTSATTFSPAVSTERGMIVTILWRLEQEPDSGAAMAFTDVKAGSYCYEAVRWAAEHEIVKGYTATTFGPDHTITRQELAAILYRYAQYKGMDVSASDDLAAFTDRPDAWAEDAMKWAVEQGIITGKGNGILDPKGEATRAQVAAMLMRFLTQNIE